MKIVVVYNQESKKDSASSLENLVVDDSVATAEEIAKNLQLVGHQTQLFELTAGTIPKLFGLKPDLFFNQAWGIGDDQDSEDKVVELLGKTGVPYTGADAKNLRLTGNKSAVKNLLAKRKIPTPAFQLVSTRDFKMNKKLAYPLIIKPEGQDCSLGINQKSVLESSRGVRDKVAILLHHFHGPVLIEQYIDGRELNVTILGNGEKAEVLPISEIIFGTAFKNRYKIVDFSAKWEKETLAYRQTVGVCPARLPVKKRQEVEKIALGTFLATGCRDYARVDFRLSKSGIPFVLEINANPAIGSEDGAVGSAKAVGYSYSQFLEKIVRLSLARDNSPH